MGSLSTYGPHCLWSTCQHPCCWEAERRNAKGIPSQNVHLPSRECISTRAGTGSPVDEFPTLSVVDASQWTKGVPKPHENFRPGCSLCVASHQCQTCLALGCPPEQNRKLERTCQLPPLACVESTQSKQQVKLNTAWIEPLASCPSSNSGSDMLVMWAPSSSDHTSTKNSGRTKSPHLAVKEIFCLPPSESLIKSNMRKKAAGVKKRVRFQLAYSPSMSQMTDTDTLEHFGDFGAWQDHPYSLLDPHEHELAPNSGVVHEAEEQRTDSAKKGDKGSFLLRNKPVVFHHIKDKRFRTVPCDATLLYKLDPKNVDEDIDWKSLRAQAYLWKKYNLSSNKCKITPPGGSTTPLTLQQKKHIRLSAIPPAVVHERKQVLLEKTCEVPSITYKRTRKGSAGDLSIEASRSLIHHAGDGTACVAPAVSESSDPTPEKLQIEAPPACQSECECDQEHRELDDGSPVETEIPAGPEPSPSPPLLHPAVDTADALTLPSLRNEKRLQWSDPLCPPLVHAEYEDMELKSPCWGPTAPPPSRQQMHPSSQ
ncbi:uncharacterized protein LOC134445341 isoform X2 [Engraulis encrasicolus]|uniref:uncharacterized protein LOC134445341 isoform X2 n=1 Tax=Engraulis encrasicolus TaxID=184585 RepID=UPI002FD43775